MTRCVYGIEQCIAESHPAWVDGLVTFPESFARILVFYVGVDGGCDVESWMEKVISDGFAHHIVSFTKCSI